MQIERPVGSNPSEQHLARVADRTFLDLWAWPNVFQRPGKELCDLLVVCDNDVLIFSDKNIQWPTGTLEVAWKRWYKRAIDSSVDQIRGATRWLSKFPDRIFADPKCEKRLPLELPPIQNRRIHGICVASGAESAASQYFNDPDGTFIILPNLKGKDHLDFTKPVFMPFSIGDVDPDGPFVHVFNQITLDIVMAELDTVTDFIEYLNARIEFLRSDVLLMAPSEAEILANYLQTIRNGKRGFPTRQDVGAPLDVKFTFAQGEYAHLVKSHKYRRDKAVLRVSYGWDRLIKFFSDGVLRDRQYKILNVEPSFQEAERALRIMALEPRIQRLSLSDAFTNAILELERRKMGRFARVVKSNSFSSEGHLAYVFLVLKGANDMEQAEYRRVRAAILQTYVMSALYDDRSLNRCVGIALSALSNEGTSEDIIAFGQPEWDESLIEQVQQARTAYDVMIDPKNSELHERSTLDIFESSTLFNISRKRGRVSGRKKRSHKDKFDRF